MRAYAVKKNDVDRIQAWFGQAGSLARAEPAGEFVRRVWQQADSMPDGNMGQLGQIVTSTKTNVWPNVLGEIAR